MERRGRPTKPGDRYACGQHRPNIEPIAPALWQRIKAHARKVLSSPDLATEVGRLSFAGELTAAQVVTALYIGKVCGNYEALQGLPKRSARSPSYDAGYGNGDLADELLDPEEKLKRAKQIADAGAAWLRLQAKIPHRLRSAVEQLCVENRAINPTVLDDVRVCLDQIAQDYGITRLRAAPNTTAKLARKGAKALDGHAPLHFDRHLEEGAGTDPVQSSTVKPPSPDRVAWLKVARAIARAGMTDDELVQAYEVMTALRDRERLRQERERGKVAATVRQ